MGNCSLGINEKGEVKFSIDAQMKRHKVQFYDQARIIATDNHLNLNSKIDQFSNLLHVIKNEEKLLIDQAISVLMDESGKWITEYADWDVNRFTKIRLHREDVDDKENLITMCYLIMIEEYPARYRNSIAKKFIQHVQDSL